MRVWFVVFTLLLALTSPSGAWPTRLVGRTLCPLAIAPVGLALTRTGDASPGQTFTVKLAATAQADCADVTLELTVPPGTTVRSGSPRWSGAMLAGELRELAVDVSVPDTSPRRFDGAVEVRAGTALLARTAQLDVGSAPRAAAAQELPIVETPEGVRILVLPAREVSP